MKTIEIIVSPQGETRIETKGFAGEECRQATKFLESSLGKQSSETPTAEMHQLQGEHDRIHEGG